MIIELDSLIREKLASSKQGCIYFLMDAAAEKNLPGILWEYENQPCYENLFLGTSASHLVLEAPYLVLISVDSPLYQWLINTLIDTPIGYFIISDTNLLSLADGLKAFNIVATPDGRAKHFRYYDPRVIVPFITAGGGAQGTLFMLLFNAIIGIDYKGSDYFCFENNQIDLEEEPDKCEVGTISFTKEQHKSLIGASTPFYVDHYMLAQYPDLKYKALTHRLEKWNKAIDASIDYGFDKANDLGLFASLSYLIGSEFHQYEKVHKVLIESDQKTLSEKIELIPETVWEEVERWTGNSYA